MEAWKAILIAFGGNAALIAVLALLAKTLVSEWLKRTTIEQQIIFSKLHDKRAEAIEKIYECLNNYVDVCKSLLAEADGATEDELNELLHELSNAAKIFRSTYRSNKLYLSIKMARKIEDAFKNSQVPSFEYIFSLGLYNNSHINKQEYESRLKTAYETFHFKEIPKVIKDLEDEFRKVLGAE